MAINVRMGSKRSDISCGSSGRIPLWTNVMTSASRKSGKGYRPTNICIAQNNQEFDENKDGDGSPRNKSWQMHIRQPSGQAVRHLGVPGTCTHMQVSTVVVSVKWNMLTIHRIVPVIFSSSVVAVPLFWASMARDIIWDSFRTLERPKSLHRRISSASNSHFHKYLMHAFPPSSTSTL